MMYIYIIETTFLQNVYRLNGNCLVPNTHIPTVEENKKLAEMTEALLQ